MVGEPRRVAEAISGQGEPRGMVPVRRAGSNVPEAFWSKLAAHYSALGQQIHLAVVADKTIFERALSFKRFLA